MRFKKVFIGVIVLTVLVSLPFVLSGALNAQEQSDQSMIFTKLDQVLANQKAIMDQLAGMRQELSVIKIRVTQSQ